MIYGLTRDQYRRYANKLIAREEKVKIQDGEMIDSVAVLLAHECGVEREELTEVVGQDYIRDLHIVKWALVQEFGADKSVVDEMAKKLIGHSQPINPIWETPDD